MKLFKIGLVLFVWILIPITQVGTYWKKGMQVCNHTYLLAEYNMIMLATANDQEAREELTKNKDLKESRKKFKRQKEMRRGI